MLSKLEITQLRLSCWQAVIKLCLVSSARLGLLGDEPVPAADSIVGALAKHMEMKLPFGMW